MKKYDEDRISQLKTIAKCKVISNFCEEKQDLLDLKANSMKQMIISSGVALLSSVGVAGSIIAGDPAVGLLSVATGAGAFFGLKSGKTTYDQCDDNIEKMTDRLTKTLNMIENLEQVYPADLSGDMLEYYFDRQSYYRNQVSGDQSETGDQQSEQQSIIDDHANSDVDMANTCEYNSVTNKSAEDKTGDTTADETQEADMNMDR